MTCTHCTHAAVMMTHRAVVADSFRARKYSRTGLNAGFCEQSKQGYNQTEVSASKRMGSIPTLDLVLTNIHTKRRDDEMTTENFSLRKLPGRTRV